MLITNFGSSSKGNCYLIQSRGTNILLDCGLPKNKIIENLAQKKLLLTDIKCCFVSHEHKDHSLSAKELSKFFPIYSCFENEYIKKINFKTLLKVGTINITAFEVKHGSCQNFGYILKDYEDILLFATDCNLIIYKFPYKFTKIMIECNYLSNLIERVEEKKIMRQINTHMSLEGCIEHLKKMDLEKCKEIYLMHLSDELSDERIMQAQIQQEFNISTFICKKNGGIK